MINVKQRLGFKDVFPDEEQAHVLTYLGKVSKESLLRTIGFCNTLPLPNFDNFFSNPELSEQILNRVQNYLYINGIKVKPETVTQQAALKFAELILSNKAKLLDNNLNDSVDDDELNLFKAFLCINTELNGSQVLNNVDEDNFEKLVDYSIVFTFPIADLALFENNNIEFLNLVYTTFFKVEQLLGFLNSKPEYVNLKNGLINSFNVVTEEEFVKQMTYLFGKLFQLKRGNSYLFEVDDEQSLKFLESMSSEEIEVDVDFTNIKNNPIYKLDDKLFSIINYFFVVDKFYRSAKFKLKELYEKDEELIAIHGNFFNFFNTHFSEKFLMKNILDEVFEKKYFVKKLDNEVELPGEPDYYSRHNNDIFVFENKDVLVAKDIKASADIEQINKVLKTKFLHDGRKHVGIGQLISTIIEIAHKTFRFDNYVNTKNSLTIYPILLVHDRIFQTLGINYRLNNWFKEQCKIRLSGLDHNLTIKNLTIIDIDTLILWLPYFKLKDKNFRDVLDLHLNIMGKKKKVTNAPSEEEGLYCVNRNLSDQLTPISARNIPYTINLQLLLNRFKNVLKDE